MSEDAVISAPPIQAETQAVQWTARYGTRNYRPLPIAVYRASGVRVWDTEGREYLDCVGCYSAVACGHLNAAVVGAARAQLEKMAIVGRVVDTPELGVFLKRLCEYTQMDRACPMNSGAEAVETAMKCVRKWAYKVKGVPEGKAEIIGFANNFHGRTISIISWSTDAQYQDGFGPLTPGFKVLPYGDADAIERAITLNTAAVIVEPIQGEGGVLVPPAGYLRRIREICTKHRVLFIADEIQTGLGRTGKMFCWEWEGAKPDGIILGKALSGGLYPVSAFLATEEIMGVFKPGDHGSTFGGNPLGSAIALASLKVLVEEKLPERANELGNWFMGELRKIKASHIKDVRGKGLLIGVELTGPARPWCEVLAERGILCKETHDHVVRFAPALTVSKADLEWALGHIREVLAMSLEPAMAGAH